MAAEIETIAYAGALPWHGLGNLVPENVTIEEMQKAAGLDWSVSKRPVLFAHSAGYEPKPFKDKFVLARDTDDRPYAVVSGRYKPVQPKQVLEFFRDLLAMHKMTLETAGSLRDGQRIWCLAKTGDVHKVLGADEVKSYLLLATSYDLTFSTLAQFTSVRVVCNNTLQQSLRDSSGRVTIPHFRDFNAEAVKDELGIGRAQWLAFTGALDAIAKVRLDRAKADEVLKSVFALSADNESLIKDPNRVHAANVLDLFSRQAYTGADLSGMTGWGLVNSLTDYVDHTKRARGQGNRLDSAWFGEGAKLKARILDETLALAA